jgi:hypothetical protein
MAFGDALRSYLANHPKSFDRTEILSSTEATLRHTATIILTALWEPASDQVAG